MCYGDWWESTVYYGAKESRFDINPSARISTPWKHKHFGSEVWGIFNILGIKNALCVGFFLDILPRFWSWHHVENEVVNPCVGVSPPTQVSPPTKISLFDIILMYFKSHNFLASYREVCYKLLLIFSRGSIWLCSGAPPPPNSIHKLKMKGVSFQADSWGPNTPFFVISLKVVTTFIREKGNNRIRVYLSSIQNERLHPQ